MNGLDLFREQFTYFYALMLDCSTVCLREQVLLICKSQADRK